MQRSFKTSSFRAFTIIELLVVVSIIALLVGILLPAIGKARDQAQLSRSQSNIKQIGTACTTYAAEFGDRQPTWINDNMSTYGNFSPTAGAAAFLNYLNVNGEDHPWMALGYGRSGAAPVVWFYGPPPNPNGTIVPFQPIVFAPGAGQKFGAFRLPNARIVSTYLNGKFYDPVYFAPKDTAVWESVEPAFDNPDEFPATINPTKWSSYCFSAAAMFNPAVFGRNSAGGYFQDPWTIPSGFRSPGLAQAQYGNLKTHVLEHNWLQNRKKTCNNAVAGGNYDGCTPYYFNHAFNSTPVALFYDGHVGMAGQQDSIDSNKRMTKQTNTANHGLWSLNTTFGPNPGSGGGYADGIGGGYSMELGQDWSSTSYHVLTIDGIKGRDFIAK
jgi:prepilin-type N-terminal cleavage/methylation domain-containing protein